MKTNVVPVNIRAILPASSGVALFLGNDDKVFVIQVEHNMGAIIDMALRGTAKDRPLTHDLIGTIFQGFGIVVERVVITELKNSTYFARLLLKQENELGQKIIEIDARPSDCLAIAAAAKRPVFVSRRLFDEVEDMSEVLERINQQTEAGEDSQTDFGAAGEDDEPSGGGEGGDEGDDSPGPKGKKPPGGK